MITSRVGPRRSTTCRSLRNVISFSSFCSSSAPVISVPSGSTTTRDSTARRISQVSSSRSSRMKRFGAAALGAEERRLRDVDVARVDQLAHLPVEERQQQRADVRAVHVRVGHDDDPVVAQLGDVEVLGADAGAERRDHGLDFVAAEHLVEAGLLDVEDLALDRQDRLEAAVAPLLGRAAGRLTFDDVELAERGIAFLAVGQLARQGAAVERALAADQIAGLARGLARAGGIDRLQDDPLGDVRVLLEERPELVVDDAFRRCP